MFSPNKNMTPHWYIGEVVDKDDPTNTGRIKVRAFGIHTDDPFVSTNDKDEKDQVEDQDLPWAFVINGAYGKIHAVPEVGEWVFGFFADGRDCQHPFVMGTLYGMNTNDMGAAPVPADDPNTDIPLPIPPVPRDPQTPQNTEALITSAAELENDPEFQAKLAEMQEKYPGLQKEQLYAIINGESAFNTAARNESTDASGLFQFIPSTAQGLGYTTGQIRNMSAAEQLGVYDQYLAQAGYRGGDLGIIQAAPAYYGRPNNFEVYSPDSRAYELNPGWRGNDGRITVGSINDYYNRNWGLA